VALASTTIFADTNTPPASTAQIEHGRYLVECIGMCGDCHSPRNDKGEFDRSQWLQGELISRKYASGTGRENNRLMMAIGVRVLIASQIL